MIFPEASEQKAAKLGARFEAWLLAQDDLTPDAERWLRMIGSQIRANADALNQFTAEHFAFHPFSQLGGLPQAVRVFGGEDQIEALLDDLGAGEEVAERYQ